MLLYCHHIVSCQISNLKPLTIALGMSNTFLLTDPLAYEDNLPDLVQSYGLPAASAAMLSLLFLCLTLMTIFKLGPKFKRCVDKDAIIRMRIITFYVLIGLSTFGIDFAQFIS